MSTKYKQIVSEREADLRSGKYNEVKKLPREEDLIEKYTLACRTNKSGKLQKFKPKNSNWEY